MARAHETGTGKGAGGVSTREAARRPRAARIEWPVAAAMANGPLSDQDETWGATIWFQQAKAAGWRYWAMVLPRDALGKLNVKRFVELNRKGGVEGQMFTEPGPALTWLQTQQARRSP